MESMIDKCVEEFGSLDILVNKCRCDWMIWDQVGDGWKMNVMTTVMKINVYGVMSAMRKAV